MRRDLVLASLLDTEAFADLTLCTPSGDEVRCHKCVLVGIRQQRMYLRRNPFDGCLFLVETDGKKRLFRVDV